MKKVKKDSLLKCGVWIKEQQGSITIGSLDKNDENIMTIPEKLNSKIIKFENDMIEALYGDKQK
ncbi:MULTISPECIES: hypothetical protein [Desulfobacula]|uniref:Uncharacterized protein n=2 Tax=Desulfobacula TaxID=28222 RepID=K0NGN8_DESTT|nr:MULTISPECIES: hypothetical protein [Desulfobacula]CCK80401.1 uncharacterized protein TOL2_C22400 [Desulfobacula toluolica Tol2]SDT98464.1 hypothetical protein SAMN04487931_103348 [Desulfobacula phenolica]